MVNEQLVKQLLEQIQHSTQEPNDIGKVNMLISQATPRMARILSVSKDLGSANRITKSLKIEQSEYSNRVLTWANRK